MNRTTRSVFRLAVFLLVTYSLGGRLASAADDWQPIAPEDLALTDNPKSPGADAMILYRESLINAGESSVSEYVRIKIFTTRGLKEGDVSISYEKSESSIRDIRARTIRPNGEVVNFEGTIFDKTVIRGEGFDYLQKTFSLPNVEPGGIIEYRFVEQYDRSRYISLSWTVQGSLYTRHARFSIKPASGSLPLYFRQMNLPLDTTPQRQSDGSFSLEVRDLPGIEKEPYMPPEETLQARVEFFYRGRQDPAQETSDQYWKRFGKYWSDELDEFVNKKGALNAEVGRVCSPSDPAETKVRKLYTRAQQIRNLTYEEERSKKEEKQENLKPNANAEDVLKHNYGNRWQINAVFMALARAAGFESTVIYVAPRDTTIFAPEVQDTKQLSSHVVWVRAEGKEYYLDPGSRFYPFGVIPWRNTGVNGLRVSKSNSEIVTTPMPAPSQALLVRQADVTMDEDGVLTGRLHVEYAGEQGAQKRMEERDEDEAGRRENFEDEIKKWLPADSTFEVTSIANWDDLTLPVCVEGTVKIPGLTTSSERRILVPLTLFEAPQVRAFQTAQRVNNIYFDYPFEEVDEVKLRMPAGYRIEILPLPQHFSPGVVSYEISATEEGNLAQVKRRLTVDGTFIARKYYASLRNFFTSVKSNDEAQIVLERTSVATKN